MGELRMTTERGLDMTDTNPTGSSLVDSYGRGHRDLRVSLTDRCSLRCTYCMPADFAQWIPSAELLTTDELMTVLSIAIDEGIDEVRLTGGEPLLRPDAVDVVRRINALPKPPRISITTNGLRLAAQAGALRDAGLERVNVSLDTLDRERFKTMTHRDRLDDVFAGLAAARAAGLSPIKINAVLMPGVNDDEAVSMLQRALDEGWRMRFIEQMPLDAAGIWRRDSMVTAEQILDKLSATFDLSPVPVRGSAPAEEWFVNGGPDTVGIIASVTRPFCGNCDRMRLTADGQLRNCLFARDEQDLRAVLRDDSLTESEIEAQVRRRLHESVAAKLPGHGINDPSFIQPPRPMSAIGG
jgi:cyclic pyranopterin phosphate synthase